jgi:hypothetical protein
MKLDMEALLNGTVSLIPDEDSYLPYNQGEFIDAIMDPIDEIFNEDGGDVRDGYYENYQTPLTNLLKYYKTYNLPGATELMGSKTAVPYILSTYMSFIAYRTTKNKNVKASELNNAVESTFNSLAYNIEDEDGNVRSDMVKLKGTEAAYKLLKKLYFTENEEIVTDENGIPAKYSLRRGVKIDGKFSLAIRKLTAKLYSMTMNDILTAQGVESELVSAMTSEEDSAAISYFLTHFLFDNSLQSSRIKPLNPDNEQFKQLATIIGCFKSCDATHYVEVDYAWLQAASGLYSDYEGPTDSNLAGYRRLRISKPESVDINGTVRDENGKAVAVLKNGKLVSRTDTWIGYTGSDEGGWFRLPFDHSYTVEMKVSKDSKINVSVGEYSFKEGSVLRSVDSDSQYDWTKLDAYKNGAVVLSLPKVSEDYNLPSKAEYSISVSGNSQSDSKDITDNTDTPDVTVVKTKYSSSVPKAMNVKAEAGTKSVTVSWKKLSSKKLKKFSKVEVQYSTSKKFNNYKSIDVSKSKTSLKIKGLKKNKTYYVRVRNVKKSTGVRYVSKWSAVCKAKAK